jgi:hypothetical protein
MQSFALGLTSLLLLAFYFRVLRQRRPDVESVPP